MESKAIGTISIITDCETGIYKMGEVDGGFDQDELKTHIATYGHEGLCEKLTCMQWQVWEALRKINQDKFFENCRTVENNSTKDLINLE